MPDPSWLSAEAVERIQKRLREAGWIEYAAYMVPEVASAVWAESPGKRAVELLAEMADYIGSAAPSGMLWDSEGGIADRYDALLRDLSEAVPTGDPKGLSEEEK